MGAQFTISGPDITNLLALSKLTKVFSISISTNPALTSLAGLQNLTDVGTGINVSGNPLLTDLDGLGGLTAVTGSLSVFDNASLTSLAALSGVTSVAGDLIIRANPKLITLAGLEQLTSVTGDLRLIGNRLILNPTGLAGLTSVGKDLVFGDEFTSFAGLGNLVTIGGSLARANGVAGSLTSLDGLANLRSVFEFVNSSQTLASAELPKLETVTENLSLRSPVLTRISLPSLISVGKGLTVGGATLATLSMDKLKTAGAGLQFVSPTKLVTVSLPALTSTGLLDVTGQRSLTSFSAPLLGKVSGATIISFNDVLPSFQLGGLTTIVGGLSMNSNPALLNLAGFSGLTSVAFVNIENNQSLPPCQVAALLARTGKQCACAGNTGTGTCP